MILAATQAHAAGVTMTTEWRYNKPIEISGDNVDGDQPNYKQLCIAPAGYEENQKCYYDSQLEFETWDDSRITFYAPADISPNGVVSLQLTNKVEKCFGSAGCDFYSEDVKRDMGTYKAAPFVSDLIDAITGKNVYELKAGTVYKVKGAFFGKDKGSIFFQFSNTSREIDPQDITAWTYDSITFKTPVGAAPLGFSVNNGAMATKYDLLSPAKSSSSSSSSPVAKPSSSKKVEAQESVFTDVAANHPYASAILWAKQSGILQGYPDGTFKPDNIVNRAEFLKIVFGASGISVNDAPGASGFRDVDDSAWYAPFVRYAKTNGVIQGYPDGSFKPEQAVNFAEALKMAYNALGVTTASASGEWYARFLVHAQANGVLFDNAARVDQGMSRKDVVWIVWKLMNHEGDWKQASAPAPTSQPLTTAAVQFKDGNFIVGTDIQPGTYRTRQGSSGCYYSRLSGFSGEFEDIIANENTDAPAIVTIEPTDKGFTSSRCGTWTQDLSAITKSQTSFGDGVFIVGTDISPGTYKSSGGSTCYYARLGGFGGQLEDIIANENTESSAIVTIAAGDKGFKSSRCGAWTKVE